MKRMMLLGLLIVLFITPAVHAQVQPFDWKPGTKVDRIKAIGGINPADSTMLYAFVYHGRVYVWGDSTGQTADGRPGVQQDYQIGTYTSTGCSLSATAGKTAVDSVINLPGNEIFIREITTFTVSSDTAMMAYGLSLTKASAQEPDTTTAVWYNQAGMSTANPSVIWKAGTSTAVVPFLRNGCVPMTISGNKLYFTIRCLRTNGTMGRGKTTFLIQRADLP